MGRLPLHRVPRRRRGRARQPQRAAAHPLLPRAARRRCGRRCPSGAWSTARSSSPSPDGLDFDALQQRIHPAESRVSKLAAETPASFVAFDLLALGDDDPASASRFGDGDARSRRRWPTPRPPVHLTPVDHRPRRSPGLVRAVRGRRASTASWPSRRRAPTSPTSACSSRSSTSAPPTASSPATGCTRAATGVGSLLLGLYDDDGRLHHLGVASSFTAARRKELTAELAPYARRRARRPPVGRMGRRRRARAGAAGGCRAAPSSLERRARTCRSRRCVPSWSPRSPTSGSTTAGSATPPASCAGAPTATPTRCTYDQLEVVPPLELHRVFGV